jgi:methylglutaconyl-CoA hydratase
MSDFETIRLNRDDDGIAWLTLARAQQHNAFNRMMIDEMTEAASMLASDDTLRAVVLSAEGKSFSAGGDLRWMQEQAAADRAGKMAEAHALAHMLLALNNLPMPLIARVQGNAFGGGIGLMAVADIVVAADTARFSLTETRLGLIPATIGPFVMRRLGVAGTRQTFITGSPMDAMRAQRLGLVSVAVPADDLDEALSNELKAVRAAAPGAMRTAKAYALGQLGQPDANVIEAAINVLADSWESDEAEAGITAFFDRKPPPWAG